MEILILAITVIIITALREVTVELLILAATVIIIVAFLRM